MEEKTKIKDTYLSLLNDRTTFYRRYVVRNELASVYTKTRLKKRRLEDLLLFEDFASVLRNKIFAKEDVSDIDIYNAASSIFFPLLKSFQSEGFKEGFRNTYGLEEYNELYFKYRKFGCAVRSFSKDLFENPDQWEEHYQEFLLEHQTTV